MGQDINSHDTRADLHSQRASTTGLVVAGFGLSAFFFITVSNLFKSTTSTFLLILALGTSSLMLPGIFICPIPLPEPSAPQSLEDGDDVQEALLPAQHHNHSYTALLSDVNSMEDRPVRYTRTDINTDEQPSNSVGGVMEVTRSIQASTQNTSTLNVHGKALLHNLDFWLLFSIYSMRMFSLFLFLFLLINVSLHEQLLGLVLHVGLESL